MDLRIIAGKYRGRKIQFPDGDDVRPTKDRIRESVFDIISEIVPGAKVLDLFSGSGAYGLEAISRGAESSVFVDNQAKCVDCAKSNALSLGIKDEADILNGDVLDIMPVLEKKGLRFDIVFADPPYNKGLAKKTLIRIIDYDIFNRPVFFVMEHHREEKVDEIHHGFVLIKNKTYNETVISIFSKK
ncbi:MAG: 16S rRNA (guanine(966)-N(2))-methyltransferase RsmD [Candidatus Omnitrophica bacterium]|nr:16S rRNA (guanine(966)-N(2))-methyltransferase RsmD [Candidatus Omnitrophota bacterium]